MSKTGNEKPEREPVLPPDPIGEEADPPVVESKKADSENNTRKLYQSMKAGIRFYACSIQDGKDELKKMREKMIKIQDKYDILETQVADRKFEMDALEKSFDALCLEHGLMNDLFPEQTEMPMGEDDDD